MGFLSLAFLQEALVFILHKKHTPLDIIQHQLLTVPMLASSLAVAMEVVYPHSPLVACGRVVAVMLQGTWFWGIAHIAYEGGLRFASGFDAAAAAAVHLSLPPPAATASAAAAAAATLAHS
ncbi:MAG: hypothetical protein WDW38_006032 [Sanguina aurantia]